MSMINKWIIPSRRNVSPKNRERCQKRSSTHASSQMWCWWRCKLLSSQTFSMLAKFIIDDSFEECLRDSLLLVALRALTTLLAAKNIRMSFTFDFRRCCCVVCACYMRQFSTASRVDELSRHHTHSMLAVIVAKKKTYFVCCVNCSNVQLARPLW